MRLQHLLPDEIVQRFVAFELRVVSAHFGSATREHDTFFALLCWPVRGSFQYYWEQVWVAEDGLGARVLDLVLKLGARVYRIGRRDDKTCTLSDDTAQWQKESDMDVAAQPSCRVVPNSPAEEHELVMLTVWRKDAIDLDESIAFPYQLHYR